MTTYQLYRVHKRLSSRYNEYIASCMQRIYVSANHEAREMLIIMRTEYPCQKHATKHLRGTFFSTQFRTFELRSNEIDNFEREFGEI